MAMEDVERRGPGGRPGSGLSTGVSCPQPDDHVGLMLVVRSSGTSRNPLLRPEFLSECRWLPIVPWASDVHPPQHNYDGT